MGCQPDPVSMQYIFWMTAITLWRQPTYLKDSKLYSTVLVSWFTVSVSFVDRTQRIVGPELVTFLQTHLQYCRIQRNYIISRRFEVNKE